MLNKSYRDTLNFNIDYALAHKKGSSLKAKHHHFKHELARIIANSLRNKKIIIESQLPRSK